MNKILYLSDYTSNQVLGGGELNDHELCKMLVNIEKKQCSKVTKQDLKGKKIIVSNFVTMPAQIKKHIADNSEYIIYEHDHKYLKNRNPGIYPNFLAPKTEIVNYNFYKNAKTVFCQSSFHEKIVKKNLKLNNTENLSGNLWSDENLSFIGKLNATKKLEKYSILDSLNWHKNTSETKFYCDKKNFKYELIKSNDHSTFLKKLSRNKYFIFIPKTPETLSRVVVEAKMLGVSVITNKRVGATYEDWYKLSGDKLIKKMKNKKQEIIKKVLEALNE